MGLIIHEYNYFNDKLHGSYVEYYHDGIQSISGEYKLGIKSGPWVWKYKDGVISLSGNYSNGQPIGSWLWIRSNRNEIVNLDSPDLEWVAKRIKDWEEVNN